MWDKKKQRESTIWRKEEIKKKAKRIMKRIREVKNRR